MWYHAIHYDPIRPAERSFKSISSETQSLTFFETKSFREILCILKHRRCLTNDVHEMYNLIWSLFAMKICISANIEDFLWFCSRLLQKLLKKQFLRGSGIEELKNCDKLMAKWWQTRNKIFILNQARNFHYFCYRGTLFKSLFALSQALCVPHL